MKGPSDQAMACVARTCVDGRKTPSAPTIADKRRLAPTPTARPKRTVLAPYTNAPSQRAPSRGSPWRKVPAAASKRGYSGGKRTIGAPAIANPLPANKLCAVPR